MTKVMCDNPNCIFSIKDVCQSPEAVLIEMGGYDAMCMTAGVFRKSYIDTDDSWNRNAVRIIGMMFSDFERQANFLRKYYND